MPWERVLRETPSPYPGAVAWSHENLIAVGQERSVCILVRPTSSLHFCLLGFSDPPSPWIPHPPPECRFWGGGSEVVNMSKYKEFVKNVEFYATAEDTNYTRK